MEKDTKQPDSWRKAILVERADPQIHPIMVRSLEYVMMKKKALLLGDASLVQSNYLLTEGKFEQVVNVDSSPSLLDDEIISRTNKHLKRIVKEFDQYDFEDRFFNLIYGKSIAFNPKETVLTVLRKINESLTSNGVFAAVWAGHGDGFRKVWYTKEELFEMYRLMNFKIIDYKVQPLKKVKGLLGNVNYIHDMYIIAKKND